MAVRLTTHSGSGLCEQVLREHVLGPDERYMPNLNLPRPPLEGHSDLRCRRSRGPPFAVDVVAERVAGGEGNRVPLQVPVGVALRGHPAVVQVDVLVLWHAGVIDWVRSVRGSSGAQLTPAFRNPFASSASTVSRKKVSLIWQPARFQEFHLQVPAAIPAQGV